MWHSSTCKRRPNAWSYWTTVAALYVGVASTATVGVARTAAAQGAQTADSERAPLRVRFAGPTECGATTRLEQLTRKLLGESAEQAAVAVEATVELRAGRRYGLHLQLGGAVRGERYLEAGNCDEVVRAGAVVIALAVNPEIALETSTATPVNGETRQSADAQQSADTQQSANIQQGAGKSGARAQPEGTSQAPLVAQTTPRAAESDGTAAAPSPSIPSSPAAPWRLLVGAGARGASGLTGDLRAGGQVFAGLFRGILGVRALGYYEPEHQTSYAEVGGVRVGAYGAGSTLCVVVFDGFLSRAEPAGRPPWDVALCGGGMYTAIGARAADLERAEEKHAWVFSGLLGATAFWALAESWVLAADLSASLPTARPRFIVEETNGRVAPLFRVQPGFIAAVNVAWVL